MKLAEKNLHLPFSLPQHTKANTPNRQNYIGITAPTALIAPKKNIVTLVRYCLFPQQQPELQVVFFRQPLPIPPSHYTLALQWVLVCVRAVFFFAVVVHSVLIRVPSCPLKPH